MNNTFVMNTRVKEGAPQQSTSVTVDFSGVTLEQALEAHLRGQSFRVWLQSNLRENGIPKETTVKFSDFVSNVRVKKVRNMTKDEIIAAASAGTYTGAEIEDMIKKLQAARDAGNAG